jgi:tetratricopeptide (TPR) repeat protein
MGLDVSQVISDNKHYETFICKLCQNLLSLDALVTKLCSHAFCKSCLKVHVMSECTCPTCQNDIGIQQIDVDEEITVFSDGISIAAASLRVAQPLAFQVLELVQVACPEKNGATNCCYIGDYAALEEHAQSHSNTNTNSDPINSKKDVKTRKTLGETLQYDMATPDTPSRPSMKDSRSLSSPSVFTMDSRDTIENTSSTEHVDETPSRLSKKLSVYSDEGFYDMQSPRTRFRRSKSLRDMGEVKTISLDELAINTPPHEDRSPELLSKSSRGDTPPLMVRRTVSGDSAPPNLPTHRSPTKILSDVPGTIDTSSSSGSPYMLASDAAAVALFHDKTVQPPLQELREMNAAKRNTTSQTDLEVSYSQATDWNMSIRSFGGLSDSYNKLESEKMETWEEEQDFDLEFEPESNGEISAEAARKKFEKADKLKKQANAKFNKGDFSAARTLYSEGITMMRAIQAVSVAECQLLSNMHSNRGVTYFREKKFARCLDDCTKAIGWDPTNEKSWIRKWRAHMANGDFDSASECLETAHQVIPDSKRILEELIKSRSDKELLTQARNCIEKKDYVRARELLKPHSRVSDNIDLLFVAAKADAYLGYTESALETVNKALRFNPTLIDGLELRGHTLFLSGDTEKGAHVLQEACSRDKTNLNTKAELQRCQKTHVAFQKGRACVKRGRYAEAVDFFTLAIKDSGFIPPLAPLYGLLRTERAEAHLLRKKFLEASKDCQEVINAQTENASAWSVRSEILVACGDQAQAFRELKKIRKSWGVDNPTIDEAFKRADFELRVKKADEELASFVNALQTGNGNVEHLILDPPDRTHHHSRRQSESRSSDNNRRKSDKLDRKDPRTEYESELGRDASGTVLPRTRRDRGSSQTPNRRSASHSRSQSMPVPPAAFEQQTELVMSPGKKKAFVPPPSIEDLTSEENTNYQRRKQSRSPSRPRDRRFSAASGVRRSSSQKHA